MWAIVTNNFEYVIKNCDLTNWKEALAVILTYTAGEQFTTLCSEYHCILLYLVANKTILLIINSHSVRLACGGNVAEHSHQIIYK